MPGDHGDQRQVEVLLADDLVVETEHVLAQEALRRRVLMGRGLR